jgi:hypothetical protein
VTQLPPDCGPWFGLRPLTADAGELNAASGGPKPDFSGLKRVGAPMRAGGMVGAGALALEAVEGVDAIEGVAPVEVLEADEVPGGVEVLTAAPPRAGRATALGGRALMDEPAWEGSMPAAACEGPGLGPGP